MRKFDTTQLRVDFVTLSKVRQEPLDEFWTIFFIEIVYNQN